MDKESGRGRKDAQGVRAQGRSVGAAYPALFEKLLKGPFTPADLALPESAGHPFTDRAWVFEIQYDGHRCMVSRFDTPQMVTRDGWEMSHVFPGLIAELDRLPARTVLDGELLMVDTDGFPDHDRLLGRQALAPGHAVACGYSRQPAALVCWDLLMLAGQDLRPLPLLERKAALKDVLRGMERIWYAGHLEEHGERMYAEARFLELEGIVAKRAQSSYPSGRTSDWVQVKTPIGVAYQSRRGGKFKE